MSRVLKYIIPLNFASVWRLRELSTALLSSGRPIARMLDDGWTLEVNRTCTDGTKNANSMLYGACRRVAFGLGYKKLITYSLPSEGGVSLTAAGWKCIGERGGGKWSRTARPRVDTHPTQIKLLWEAIA